MESLMGRLGIEVRETIHQVNGLLDMVTVEPLSLGQSQCLSRCRESVDQLLRTSSELAELSRSGAVPFTSSPFHLTDAVGEIADLMALLAARKGLKFDYAIQGLVPTSIISDKTLLQDILHRVLDNAIRFTESGRIGLVLTAADQGLDWVVLSFEISDTGRGIPKEVLFANLESLPSQLPRHGFGLMIVRKSLSSLGGEMSVVSNTVSGTTLGITIPTAIAHSGPPRGPSTALSGVFAPAQLRLLVAEDSNDSFFLFQSYLKGEGHRITRAFTGAEAVEIAQAAEHDFIVMDVHMPVMDGYAATRIIRNWETEQGRARLPILLISADELATQIRIGAAAGCSGYLAKPTNKAQVLAALAFYANPMRVPGLAPRPDVSERL